METKIKKFKVGDVEVLVKTNDNMYYTAYDPHNEYCCKSFGIISRNGMEQEVNGGLSQEEVIRIIAEKINNVTPGTYDNIKVVEA